MTTTTPLETDRTVRRLAGVLAAPVVALATRLVLTQGLGIELSAGGSTVTWSSVLIAALAAGVAGWLVLVALERLGGNVLQRWTMITLAVLVLSPFPGHWRPARRPPAAWGWRPCTSSSRPCSSRRWHLHPRDGAARVHVISPCGPALLLDSNEFSVTPWMLMPLSWATGSPDSLPLPS